MWLSASALTFPCPHFPAPTPHPGDRACVRHVLGQSSTTKSHLLLLRVYKCPCNVYVWSVCHCAPCGGQRATLCSQFFPSTFTWVLGHQVFSLCSKHFCLLSHHGGVPAPHNHILLRFLNDLSNEWSWVKRGHAQGN